MTAALADTAPVDPLAPTPDGIWHGSGVTVRRVGSARLAGRLIGARRIDGRLIVEHRLTPGQVCDDAAVTLVAGLADAGLVVGQSDFEEVFVGVVRSAVNGAIPAWRRFYANSLARLENGSSAFAPVHTHAAGLVEGRDVIDLGSCFGFFPLRLAARGIGVVATDLSATTMGLLARMAPVLRRRVLTMACDAASVPLPDGCAATVTALHLLEHLSPLLAEAVLDEAVRLARRRVVVAVPFEAEPTAHFGHVQSFCPAALGRLAGRLRERHPGLRVRTAEHHGGWLIADR